MGQVANAVKPEVRARQSRRPARATLRPAAGLLLALLAMTATGCAHTDPLAALSVDPVTTATIMPLSADANMLADEAAIADALSEGAFTEPLPWSNPSTGSSGVISAVANAADGGCRDFRTTRHAFDGIALFEGRACPAASGGLRIDRFGRTEG